jgi:ABC-type sugar transport system ATPase subunit
VTSVSPLIETRGLAKRYPGVMALKGVDFSAEAGEIHALVGANGAGKSSLMNLLSGATSPSAGEILLAGEPVQFSSPAAALEQGIATVYQEFSLVPQLSVSRNVFLGREPRGRFGLIDQGRLAAETRTLLDRFSLGLDPKIEVSRLSVAEQQLVEIAKALSFAGRVLILDEPTAVLSLSEQSNLFTIMRKLRADGLLILYVSHRLEEVLAIADRITVLRDGKKVATRAVAGLAMADLVEMMIGSPTASSRDGITVSADAPEYVATYRTADSTGRLAIRAGEILGLAGLVGAGRTTFARALAGESAQRR